MKPVLTLNTGRCIGPGYPTYIIAEIGSNHDGSLDKAKRLVALAKQAGADAVKIQSFQVQGLINPLRQGETGWEPHPAWPILERLTVPEGWHALLQQTCKDEGIDFCSTPFDADRLALLKSLQVPLLKMASGDLTYHDFLRQVAETRIPVIMSTGIATLEEVQAAMAILEDAGCTEVALLHCVSLYPPQFSDLNLKALLTLQQTFKVPVGLSDHTPGSIAAVGAVALGARVIEKHLTDDTTLPGPDHPYALDGPAFTQLVTDIRQLEAALGDGVKYPCPGEIPERVGARRGIYTAQDIPAGAHLSPKLLKAVRHAYVEGVPVQEMEQLYGKVTTHALPAHTLVTRDAVMDG